MTKSRRNTISRTLLLPMLTKQRHKFSASVRHVVRSYLRNLDAYYLCYLSVYKCVKELCDTCYFSGQLKVGELAELHDFFANAYYKNVDEKGFEEYDNDIFQD